LAVAATDSAGVKAPFSESGSFVSLAAPGVDVFGATSGALKLRTTQQSALPGLVGGYGFASGTSFAAPQVAGAAALVWAANPSLSAVAVATILKRTASGHGAWNAGTGFGVLDVAAAVAAARQAALGS
jgi:serine protease